MSQTDTYWDFPYGVSVRHYAWSGRYEIRSNGHFINSYTELRVAFKNAAEIAANIAPDEPF